ncbi:MAG: cysteine hydrolase [Candidatus Dormibacteraeota bacterium]|nr:cysteine hydrolase [Candidatus Dormibacteraeota bacterium]
MSRALLVIDVQNEYFAGGALPITHPVDSLKRITDAMDGAAEAGIPIVLIQHGTEAADATAFKKGTRGWQIRPEVDFRKRAAVIEKTMPGAFTGTDLEAWLKKNGVDTLVIAGYMTQMCCDTTARQAVHLGYRVEFLSDATGTLDLSNEAGSVKAEELHRAILVTQQARFSKVLSVADWVSSVGVSQA